MKKNVLKKFAAAALAAATVMSSMSVMAFADEAGETENTGSVTITNILQKQNSKGVWYDYLTTDSGQTYNNVRSATHTYNYNISSSGKYRCKSIMKGAVSGYTETVTVYSGTYTK